MSRWFQDSVPARVQTTTLGAVGGWLGIRAKTHADTLLVTSSTNLSFGEVPLSPSSDGRRNRVAFRVDPNSEIEVQVPVGSDKFRVFHLTEHRPPDPVCSATLSAVDWAMKQGALLHQAGPLTPAYLPDAARLLGFEVNTGRKCGSLGTISTTAVQERPECSVPGHFCVEE